jgi:ABC-2 type transport system permease protein
MTKDEGMTNAQMTNDKRRPIAVRHSEFVIPSSFVIRHSSFRKYARIFRVSLIERLTYRGDFLLGTILRFLPMITTILLWRAVYLGAQADGTTELAGFRYSEMIAYLLLVHISRMFSSMPGLAGGIARDIRDGTLKKYLIQPLDMVGYLLAYRCAHKVAYIVTSALPYAGIFALFSSYFDHLPVWPTFAGYVTSLVLAFVVGFHFEACIGMVGFWLLEVSSLMYVVMALNFFISGQMFPLDLLPSMQVGSFTIDWAAVLKSLPTQYLAYFPAAVFLGKIQGMDLWRGLLGEVVWAVVLIGLTRVLYRIGLKRYSAYGG